MKEPEFQAYLREVKNVNAEMISNWERKNHWKDFMEDFNTSTMPSKKYYNLAAWEAKQINKSIEKQQKQLDKGASRYSNELLGERELSSYRSAFADEEEARLQKKKERDQQKFNSSVQGSPFGEEGGGDRAKGAIQKTPVVPVPSLWFSLLNSFAFHRLLSFLFLGAVLLLLLGKLVRFALKTAIEASELPRTQERDRVLVTSFGGYAGSSV